MSVTNRLAALETAAADVQAKRQTTAGGMDLSRLTTGELLELRAIREKCAPDGGPADLKRLTDDELETLRNLQAKATPTPNAGRVPERI